MKSVAFTFGRFNPPTIGHAKLIRKVASIRADKFYIFPSWRQNSQTDPLPHKIKYAYMKRAFPKYAKNIVSDPRIKIVLHAVVLLYDMGFEKVTMVVGSDRVGDFQRMLNRYNGIDSKHGYYEFPTDIKVVSAGQRNPDAKGVSGVSASRLRELVRNGEKDLFLYRLPDILSKRDGENLYNDLQKYMGIREIYEVGTNAYREYLQAITPEEEIQNFVTERPLSDNEKKKKEEIVKALKRDHSNWEKSKIYAIATAAAKKWATRRKRWKDPWDPKKPRKLKRKKYSEHVVI
jgi:hypothetical protein